MYSLTWMQYPQGHVQSMSVMAHSDRHLCKDSFSVLPTFSNGFLIPLSISSIVRFTKPKPIYVSRYTKLTAQIDLTVLLQASVLKVLCHTAQKIAVAYKISTVLSI